MNKQQWWWTTIGEVSVLHCHHNHPKQQAPRRPFQNSCPAASHTATLCLIPTHNNTHLHALHIDHGPTTRAANVTTEKVARQGLQDHTCALVSVGNGMGDESKCDGRPRRHLSRGRCDVKPLRNGLRGILSWRTLRILVCIARITTLSITAADLGTVCQHARATVCRERLNARGDAHGSVSHVGNYNHAPRGGVCRDGAEDGVEVRHHEPRRDNLSRDGERAHSDGSAQLRASKHARVRTQALRTHSEYIATPPPPPPHSPARQQSSGQTVHGTLCLGCNQHSLSGAPNGRRFRWRQGEESVIEFLVGVQHLVMAQHGQRTGLPLQPTW